MPGGSGPLQLFSYSPSLFAHDWCMSRGQRYLGCVSVGVQRSSLPLCGLSVSTHTDGAVQWGCAVALCGAVQWGCAVELCGAVQWGYTVGLCSGAVQWGYAVGLCSGAVQWGCVGLCSGAMQWGCAVGLCSGAVQWGCAVGLCSGAVQWGCAVGLCGAVWGSAVGVCSGAVQWGYSVLLQGLALYIVPGKQNWLKYSTSVNGNTITQSSTTTPGQGAHRPPAALQEGQEQGTGPHMDVGMRQPSPDGVCVNMSDIETPPPMHCQ